MSQVSSCADVSGTAHSQRLPLACAYAIEGLTSISVNFLMNGIAFYTTQQFGWSAMQNLLLMMAQGVVYAAGALSAGVFASRFKKTSLLAVVSVALLVMIGVMWASTSPTAIIPVLLVFTFTSTLTWPLVESLVTEGCDAKKMNRRITLYNMTWSSVCVLVIAIYSTLLEYWPAGPMVIPIVCQVLCFIAAMVLAATHRTPPAVAADAHAHGDPEVARQLASCRVLALWLSRISLPASFVVANSLMAIFPRFTVAAEMGAIWPSAVASLWMAGRFVTFIFLGMSDWWHTRPKLLLLGGVLILLSFLMIGLPAERIGPFADLSLGWIIAIIAIAEIILGVVAGYVFSASLYFGMVLSDGSTEHGGYHEALIGAGMILGPGLAAAAQFLGPAGQRWPAIVAVSALMLFTITASGYTTVHLRKK